MLPCAIRRRSASAVMSTSSTCSAARTTASGTVSRCGTPVICWTTSLSDSRCCTLTVLMTSIPAASSSSTSSQRFSCTTRARHVRMRQLVHRAPLLDVWRAPRPDRALRIRRRGRSPSGGAVSRVPRAFRQCEDGRGFPRTPPRRRRPEWPAGAPRRAWRTSFRRLARRRDRYGAFPVLPSRG